MIKKIYVKNFKCFEEISVECRELNLFTGVNGMGKSTIIQSLLLLRQTSEQFVPGRENAALLNGKYVSLGTMRDISYWYKKDDKISILAEEDNYIFQCEYDIGTNALVVKNKILHMEPSTLGGEGFEYISAERLGPRRYYDDLERDVYAPAQVGAKGEHTISSLYYLGRDLQVYENMKHDTENSSTLELQVNAWMSEISPGIKVKAIPYLDANMMGLRYAKISMLGEESTNAVNMGFGVSYVLPVVVALLKARNSLHIKIIMKRLQILEDYFSNFNGKFEKDKLGFDCREESESVKKNKKLRGMRVFELPDKREEFFSWHISFSGNFPGRIHFIPNAKECVGVIGYVGKHLPTSNHPTP